MTPVSMRATDLDTPPPLPLAAPTGEVELVSGAAHFSRVVLDGILRAEVSVDIATADFKAMLLPGAVLPASIPGVGGIRSTTSRGGTGRASTPRFKRGRRGEAISIVEALRGLAVRGVEVRLLHAGVPSGPALRELRNAIDPATPGRLTIRRCPRVHMKAIIIDSAAMYLGSANLTGAGLGAKGEHKRNFELGIWTTAAPLIDGVLGEFNALWEGERCRLCKRKEVCPVPLEEPHLC